MTNRILPPGHGPADENDPEVAALDRLIADAARDYHRPPAQVPRDAMWEAIMAARTTRAGAAPAAPVVAAAPETPVVSLDAARAARRAPAPQFTRTGWSSSLSSSWSLAAAASLLLVAGIGVGRWWEWRAQAGAPASTVAAVATPDTATPDGARGTDTMTAAVPRTLAAAPTLESPTESSTPSLDPADRLPTREVASRAGRAGRATGRAGEGRTDGDRLAYDVATVRHLTSVEALLVSYRADPLDSLADARVAQWARTLLQDTRLLLDSPAASSPVRRRLFEDLELVLVQMARLAPADSTVNPARLRREREERALIDGTMRDARVLPRLRREIPAGIGT
jgi:hypothetical protein